MDTVLSRETSLGRLETEQQWDIVVIGGGATGLGVAVDAATRGYKTLLLEAYDFAKGTSSRSTKLVHGGVRYLAQGNVKLVREALHERGLLLRNAPHLAHDLAFIVPAYTWWSLPYYGVGLKLYDILAGKLGLGATEILSTAETLHRAPTLEPHGLRGGIQYYDGQFDDTRLAVTLLRTFLDAGGTALNYAPVQSIQKTNSRISGVVARDAERGDDLHIKARVVVNATGVYADAVRRMDDAQVNRIIAPSQGIHLVLPRSFLPGAHAIMIPKTDDGRVIFAVPWHDRVVLGTTDTPVKEIEIEPRPLEEEVTFLLKHAARYLSKDPSRADVLSIFAGLRPLVKAGDAHNTAALSRDHTLLLSPAGLITITGGKWTTYRRMAVDAVNKAAEVGNLGNAPSRTETLRLHGWQDTSASEPLAVYGADAPAVRQLIGERPEWSQPLHPNLPYSAGEVVWAARYELARTVEDVLARRTRALLLDAHASIEAAPRVAQLLAGEIDHAAAWERDQVRQFTTIAEGYMIA